MGLQGCQPQQAGLSMVQLHSIDNAPVRFTFMDGCMPSWQTTCYQSCLAAGLELC